MKKNIKAENQAIVDYKTLLKEVTDEKIRDIIIEIMNDEKDHAHNLEIVTRYLKGDKNALQELTKSFFTIEGAGKEEAVFLKSIGANFYLNTNSWTAIVDMAAPEFRTLADLSKAGKARIREL